MQDVDSVCTHIHAQGFVCVLKDDFGFIEQHDNHRVVFFHTSEVAESRCRKSSRRVDWACVWPIYVYL